MRKKVEGIIVRSRARWHEYGEKNSKYFFNLEKRNHISNKFSPGAPTPNAPG